MAGLIFIGLIIGWFFAALWFARLLTKGIKAEGWRVLAISVFVLLLMVLPLSDEIVGGFQFRALCKENAVLKIDAEKIKGKTISVQSEPLNQEVANTAVKIFVSKVTYRDITTREEYGSFASYFARGGLLVSTLAGGHPMQPLSIHPSECGGPPILFTSQKYGFTYQQK